MERNIRFKRKGEIDEQELQVLSDAKTYDISSSHSSTLTIMDNSNEFDTFVYNDNTGRISIERVTGGQCPNTDIDKKFKIIRNTPIESQHKCKPTIDLNQNIIFDEFKYHSNSDDNDDDVTININSHNKLRRMSAMEHGKSQQERLTKEKLERKIAKHKLALWCSKKLCCTLNCICEIHMTIHYETLMLLLILLCCILTVIDRLTVNIFPLWINAKVDKHGDWGSQVFMLTGIICGRILVVSSTFMFIFQMKVFWNIVFENKPNWLICEDITVSNNRLHKIVGWGLVGIPVMTHMYLFFLPIMTGNPFHLFKTWWRYGYIHRLILQYICTYENIFRPMDPNTDFYMEIYHHGHVYASYNDFYALIIVKYTIFVSHNMRQYIRNLNIYQTTICFVLFFPISIYGKFKKNHWILAHYCHVVGATLYTSEILRSTLTPHCWIFTGPFILFYIIDRIIGTYYYRRSKAKIIVKQTLSDGYIMLLLKLEKEYHFKNIGNVFWLNTSSNLWRCNPAHPFTGFTNHGNFSKFLNPLPLCSEKHKFSIHPSVKNKASTPQSEIDLVEWGKYELKRQQTQSVISKITSDTDIHSSNSNINNKDWDIGVLYVILYQLTCFVQITYKWT